MEIRVVDRNTWGEHRQIIEAAAVDWQTLDALLADYSSDGGVLRLQKRNSGVYFHRFLNPANLQREIDSGLLTQLDHNSGAAFSAESGETNFHNIFARDKVANLVGTVWRSRRCAGQSRGRLEDRQSRSGNGSATVVQDCS